MNVPAPIALALPSPHRCRGRRDTNVTPLRFDRAHVATTMQQPLGVPAHPRISDAAARALVQAIMDADLLGVALLRGPDHAHAMVNAKYHDLVGEAESMLGRPMADVLPLHHAPEALIARVVAGNGPVVQANVLFQTVTSGVPRARWVTLTYHAVDEPDDAVLVLAQDVTDHVRERRRAEFFVKLVGDLLPSLDERAAVRSVVTQTQFALGATASSIFRVTPDGATLHGAIGEWDWTRTSFEVPTSGWPTVEAAFAKGHAQYITAGEARLGELGWFEKRGIAAALCIPLRVGEHAVGVLFFDFDSVRAPEPGSVEFAEHVAAHCAAALVRASARRS